MEWDWEADCKRYAPKVLTGKMGHWCPDWDYMPIDETCPEFECCTCPKDELETPLVAKEG